METRKLEERFEQAQKLESLGVLAGGIAHDFNNLLVGVLGHSRLAAEDLPDDSPVQKSIQSIDRAARRAADLCRQMLAYAGKVPVSIGTLDLRETVEEIGELLRASLSSSSAIDYQFDSDLSAIQADAQINEVIFSGGDPLMAKDIHLANLAQKICSIPHIKRLRIHTRLPVVMPNRIDGDFTQWFAKLPLQRIMVLHINHANEISASLKRKLQLLQEAGITLLNQAVLLRGINDTVDAQVRLSESLFDAGILPYYLHVLDKVQGTAHFDLETAHATQLMRDVSAELPGFLVPKLVREVGGKRSKSQLDLHMLAND